MSVMFLATILDHSDSSYLEFSNLGENVFKLLPLS